MKYYPPELVVLGSATSAIQQSSTKLGQDPDNPIDTTVPAYQADE
jgi:hypothetical protein